MSGRGREARPTSSFSRNDTHQTAIKRIISHCHAEYPYKKRFLEMGWLPPSPDGISMCQKSSLRGYCRKEGNHDEGYDDWR